MKQEKEKEEYGMTEFEDEKAIKLFCKSVKMDEDEILAQVREDYDRGYSLVEAKRAEFENNLKLYNNQKKNTLKEKVGDTTVYNIHTSLMARLYMSKTEVLFEGTQIGDEVIADNINATYREDFETPYMEKIKYKFIWDLLFYGVGIMAKSGWDGKEKRAKFQTIDPRLVIPDPDGDYFTGNYSFIGFERLASKTQLIKEGLWDDELIPISTQGTTYRGADRVLRDDQSRKGLNIHNGESTYNATYNIYYHWSYFEGKLALVITGNNNTELLGVKEYNCFPFVISHYRPDGTWCGKNVVDDTGDVQRVKAIIANLRLDKAKAELYPMYLYNTRLLKNKNDLDFGFNKLIPVNPLEGEPLNNAITPLQKDFRADNSYLIENSLDQQVERATSIGAIAQGSDPTRRETATTNKLVQSNTDINLNLTAKLLNMGYKRLAEIWYEAIVDNLTTGDKKNVKIYNGMTYVPYKLSRKDLVRDGQMKVIIKSESEVTEKRQKEINAFNMALPILQANGLDKFSMNYAYRDFLRNLGYEEKKVWTVIKETPEEIRVRQDIEMLNAGIRVIPDDSINVDAALLLIKSANPGFNKEFYIMKLLEMYTAQQKQQALLGQASGQNQQQQAMQNNVAAQAGAGLQNIAQQFTG